MRALAIPVVLSIVATPLWADDSPKDDPAAIEYWIARLGHDDPKVRQQASESLRDIGTAALPALARAARSNDPEVRNRANTLTQQIEKDAEQPRGLDVLPPAPPGDQLPRRLLPLIPRDFPPGAFQRFSRSFSSSRDGRTIDITEDNDGITVTTTQKRDGKTVTQVARARDRQTLRKEHPDAYKLYEEHADRMRLRASPLQAPMLQPPAGLDRLDLAEFERDQIDRAFEHARQAMANHRKLLDHHRDMMLEHRKLVEELRKQALEEIERLREEP